MGKQDDLVSIIVPVYNIESYIERCIKSIMNQKYERIEIILVDDGSTDRSGMICDRYAKKDDRIQVIHKKNEGLVRARKAGLEKVTGKYVGFVDGDDHIDEDMYQGLVENIKETGADLVHSGCIFGGKREMIPKAEVIDLEKEGRGAFLERYIFDQASDRYIPPSIWSKLFKAGLIKSSYDLVPDTQSIGEDWINIVGAVSQSKRISIQDKAAYHYTIRQGSLSHLDSIEDLMWQPGYYRALEDVLKRYGHYEKIKERLDSLFLNTLFSCIERRYPNDLVITRYLFKRIDMLLGKKIVLYGAGAVGKSYYSQICRYPACDIVAWVDRDHENIHFDHVEVVGREQIPVVDFDYLIIAIKDKEKAGSIKRSLIEEEGIEGSKIIWEAPLNICNVKRR